jgi:hypothetical protein
MEQSDSYQGIASARTSIAAGPRPPQWLKPI